MVQVNSIRPSGSNLHRPLLRLGTASASCGRREPEESWLASPALTSSSRASAPGIEPVCEEFTLVLKVNGSPVVARVTRFHMTTVSPPRALGEEVKLGPQPAMSITMSTMAGRKDWDGLQNGLSFKARVGGKPGTLT